MKKFSKSNPEHLQFVQSNVGDEMQESVYHTEPGVFEYIGTINKVESYSDTLGELGIIEVAFYCTTDDSRRFKPVITWKMLSTKIKAGKKESPRTVNHKIAWGKMSSWLRKLSGISISKFKGNEQKAFKSAIWLDFWGKTESIELIEEDKTIEITLPDLAGITAKFRCTVTESQSISEKTGRHFLNSDWNIIEFIGNRAKDENVKDSEDNKELTDSEEVDFIY